MTTARLTLRTPVEGDAEPLRAYYLRNAERFTPWEPSRPDDLRFHVTWIEQQRVEQRRSGHAAAFLAYTKAPPADLVAVVSLGGFTQEEQPTAMISYTVDGAYEGRGYANEAVECVVRYAFEELGLSAVSAYYHPDNVRSGKLVERLGFSIVARTPVVPGFENLVRPQVIAVRRGAAAPC